MAKVKIQGHASGTGVLTVTAPNTSTDRTITLPDESVTLGAATPSIDDNGNATAITIDSDENVGIGTSSPVGGKKLHINDSSTWAALRFTGGGGNFLDVKSYGDTSSGSIIEAGGNQPFRIYVNSSERMRVTSDGITFNGDTAAANALDDYEEGTWNPSFGADNQGFTIGSTSASVGKYVKIGSLVHFQMYITIQNSTPTSQGFRIGGLPYANNSSAFAFFPIGGTYSGTNANAIHDKAQWRLDKNGTTFRFYIASENANKDGNQAWGGSNTEYSFDVSGTYMVTI